MCDSVYTVLTKQSSGKIIFGSSFWFLTNRLGLLCVLMCSQVNGPRVHHGAGEQVSQLGAESRRHCLVGRCERRGHEERRCFRCRRNDVRGMNEEAWGRGGVGRHRVVDGPHTGGSGGSCRGGLMQLGFQLGLLFSAQTKTY